MAQIVKLKPEFVEKYKECHAKVWPEVLKQIKDCNIEDCESDPFIGPCNAAILYCVEDGSAPELEMLYSS